MKVIIVGSGKIGYTIAKVLSPEKDVNVTLVDTNPAVFSDLAEPIDVIFIAGSGLNEKTLLEAGAKEADLIVCTTNADEVNVLCCIMAKHLGTKHTAARVRNPDYALEFNKLWKSLGIDMVINPEQQTARKISRLLRYPTADDVDTFIDGRVELVSFKVSETPDFFIGKSVSQIFNKNMGIILATVERGNQAIIPHGDLIFEKCDVINILGRPSNIMSFFIHIGKKPKTQEMMIIGGGKITYYLAELLNRHTIKTNIKIIEKDREKCEALCEALSAINRHCLFIHGDGTNEELLNAEEIKNMNALACLTDRDEENAIISLYGLQMGVKKVITKVNHINQNMIKDLGVELGSIITPQKITSDIVVRYVDGLKGVTGSNIRTMHRIFSGDDGNVEAIEFQVNQKARCLDIPIKDLYLKQGILIGCILRDSTIIIPSGETQIQMNDNVIIVAQGSNIQELDDILMNKKDVLA